MSTTASSQLAAAADVHPKGLNRDDHRLHIAQQPISCKVFLGKEKDRKPIDPPPIIKLQISSRKDPGQAHLQSPFYFVTCSLLHNDQSYATAEKNLVKNGLSGTLVSSIHRLKDPNNKEGGYFIFGDLSVKLEGTFRLQFTLFEVQNQIAEQLASISSDPFVVHPAKNFPGMAESTFLTRTFSEQGVRLRLRKEPRFRLGNRGPASDDYQPRQYNSHKRRQSQISIGASPIEQGQFSLQSNPQSAGFVEPLRSQTNDFSPFGGTIQSSANSTPGLFDPMLQRQSLSSHSGGSYGSVGEDGSSKRSKMDPEQPQSSGWNQNYALGGSQYGTRMGTYQQPTQAYGQMSQGISSNYGRDQPSPYGPRRAEGQYTSYDINNARQVQSSPTGYFPQQPQSQFSSLQQSHAFAQPISQSMSQNFPTPLRMNSFDTPIYSQGTSNFMPRGSFSGMGGLQPSQGFRQPSISQGTLNYGNSASQLPPPNSGADYTYSSGWPPKDNVPGQ